MTKKMIKQRSRELGDLIFGGLEMWVKAGEMLVQLVDEDSDVYDKILAENPQLSRNVLGRFEQIGRRVIDPRLLLRGCPGYSRAKQLPYSDQRRVLDQPVKLICGLDDDDHRLVELSSMSHKEARQAFSRGGVRTLDEQKRYLRSRAEDETLKALELETDYMVKRGRVTFTKGVSLGVSEMAAVLRQMTNN